VQANPLEAIRLFRLAAEQGNENGQTYLGYAYAVGRGVEKDPREAAWWYRKAAEQGNSTAQLHLAIAHLVGEGVHKDKAEAETWLERSSQQGNAIGSFQLALLNLEKPGPGRLDPLSTRVAIEKFALAAEQGYSLGAFALGEVFTGRLAKYHVNEDKLVACKWYTIASRLEGQGDWERLQPEQVAAMRKDLPGRIEKVRKSLGPTQKAECEAGASDWVRGHPRGRDE
jgi:TPR repeat protein